MGCFIGTCFRTESLLEPENRCLDDLETLKKLTNTVFEQCGAIFQPGIGGYRAGNCPAGDLLIRIQFWFENLLVAYPFASQSSVHLTAINFFLQHLSHIILSDNEATRPAVRAYAMEALLIIGNSPSPAKEWSRFHVCVTIRELTRTQPAFLRSPLRTFLGCCIDSSSFASHFGYHCSHPFQIMTLSQLNSAVSATGQRLLAHQLPAEMIDALHNPLVLQFVDQFSHSTELTSRFQEYQDVIDEILSNQDWLIDPLLVSHVELNTEHVESL